MTKEIFPQELTVQASEVALYVRVAGNPHSGNVLIAINGGPGLSSHYMLNLEDLAGENFAVVFAALGITHREASFFISRFEASGALDRTLRYIWLSSEGVFGLAVGVMASFVTIYILFGAFALGYGVLMVPSGWWADRYGPRRFLAAIVLLWSVCTAWTGLIVADFMKDIETSLRTCAVDPATAIATVTERALFSEVIGPLPPGLRIARERVHTRAHRLRAFHLVRNEFPDPIYVISCHVYRCSPEGGSIGGVPKSKPRG